MQTDASSSSFPVLILLGPPGSGKGTQAIRLSKALGIPHISTGDLFRDNIKRGTELGARAKRFIDAGQLSPDELVLDMLFDRIAQQDCAKGFLLDGFPRTLRQAEALERHLGSKEKEMIALDLAVPDETIVKRISGRLTCKNCGYAHNIYFSPPQKEGTCDVCSGELYQRSDDQATVVQERLRVYQELTSPLTDYYRIKKVLFPVKGDQVPDKVFEDLLTSYQRALSAKI